MAACYRFVVSGLVQGVFFRQATVNQASRLGLDGWVHNRPDGCVEGVAHGAPAALEALRAWLQKGPPAAHVSSVSWTPDAETPAPGFTVQRGPPAVAARPGSAPQ